jgi:sporulation integral membrane protein YlbJ
MKKYIKNLFFLSAILCVLMGIVRNPEISLNSALNGLATWANIVFPSLFPFFIISEILIEMGFVNFIGDSLQPVMRPMFNVSGEGAFPFAMSIISGYPMGAKITSLLREKKLISKAEADKIVCFSSTSGPLFMLGAVSVGMLKTPAAAPLVLYPHYLGAITVGLILRFVGKKYNPNTRSNRYIIKNPLIYINKDYSIGMILGNCVKNSLNTIFTVGGFIIFYSVAIELLFASKTFDKIMHLIDYIIPLKINMDILQGLIAGTLEITTGCNKIASLNIDFIQKILIINFLIGWGGFSIHSQALSFISKTDINAKMYIFSKFLHGILSSIYTLIFYILKYKDSVEFTFIPSPYIPENIYSNNWLNLFIKSTKLALLILLYMVICSIILAIIGKISAKNN